MIRIRQSRPEDGQQAIEIWRAAVDATHHFLSPEDRRAIDAEVCAFLPELPLWLALDNSDHPIAFMGLVGASLEALFVHPSYHRCGIGRALVDHALATVQPSVLARCREASLDQICTFMPNARP